MDENDAEKIMKRCQIGTMNYEEANALHADCYGMIGRLRAKVEELERESENLRQQAMNQATEARCQRSTVHEMYELVTGKTGEPGDWNGAEPLRKFLRSHCVITTDQIDAAWTRAIERYGTKGIAAEHIFWAFAELGIRRCEGCGESGRMVLDEAPDGRQQYDRCMDCNGHKWIKE